MKRFIIFLVLLVGLQLSAQEIGLRLGSFENSNIAIDGIVNFDDHTRLHGDISFGKGIGAHLLYDFKVKPFGAPKSRFQYYLGTGVGLFIGNSFVLGVNGEAGLEYLFKKTPITFGLDWRPQINILSKTALNLLQFGLNIRYRINEI